MKLIPLTRGLFAQVDDWNYKFLMQWKWYAAKYNHTYYAIRNLKREGNKRERIRMHRQIMNTSDNMEVDHRDHNGLNCQEYNMRNCTHHQNMMNKKAPTIVYRGVSHIKNKYIKAAIKINGKSIHIGYFPTEELAARAYDAKAKELFGEFAILNFK